MPRPDRRHRTTADDCASEIRAAAERVAAATWRDWPTALAEVHRAARSGATVELALRTEPQLSRDRMHALVVGAGFECINIRSARERLTRTITARRLRSLPDLIAPGLRLLICGLNPSLYSADAGVPFARPGNRFWPAALHAELIVRCRNPVDALRRGIGFTDLVKRATTAAAELRADEYVAGAARVAALISLYRPTATCFVGLEGWRRAVDRGAQPGWIRGGFGGRPAYLMPSTSGRNAHTQMPDLARYLAHAAGRPDTGLAPHPGFRAR